MEISDITRLPQLSPLKKASSTADNPTDIAFGIGQDQLVELSPQGNILQLAEQAQQNRQASLKQTTTANSDNDSQTTTDYVRVSSSVGQAQKNNLSAEQATDIYRSIEKLL